MEALRRECVYKAACSGEGSGTVTKPTKKPHGGFSVFVREAITRFFAAKAMRASDETDLQTT